MHLTGEVNRTNYKEKGECAMDAYETCNACPTRTSEEQMKMRKCKSCVQGCFPFGPSEHLTSEFLKETKIMDATKCFMIIKIIPKNFL